MKNDFNRNGKSDFVVTSPWGLGVVEYKNNALASAAMAANGSRLGQWLLNSHDNQVAGRGDFDGDGVTELFVTSPWGIGILKQSGTSFTSIAMAQNGTRHGGWIVNTNDNLFLQVADFDRDGKDEILVSSPWGIGIFKYVPGGFTTLMLAPNGTRFGGWLLNTNDNFFTLAGDFDGDNGAEILVTSGWGAGILKFNGTTLTSPAMMPNGTTFGSWVLNTATDRFEAAGNFTGDSREEILLSSSSKTGFFRLNGSTLEEVVYVSSGTAIGSWVINSRTDEISVTGDFDGDGKAELLFRNNTGIGIFKLGPAGLSCLAQWNNGTRRGGWLLNTADNRLHYSGDFNGDGRADIFISSPWGVGVLQYRNNAFEVLCMHPNGTRLGGWMLNTGDNDWEAGLGKSYALLIYHSQWTGAINNTSAFLRNRGYYVYAIPNAAAGFSRLEGLALSLKPADRMFVYLAGHGNSARPFGNMTREASLNHGLQFEDGQVVSYHRFANAFKLLGDKGIDLSILDGSCDGGEAVVCATGERYLALSTTSTHAPGITNTPDPSEIMKLFPKPGRFGLWWSPSYCASLLTHKTPHRFFQKIYRNDNSDISFKSLFYKPAISFYLNAGSSWDLMVNYCYLFRYIYPNEFNGLSQADKDKTTVPLDTYLTNERFYFDNFAPVIAQLKGLLTTPDLVSRAAEVYAGAFPRPWQTLFGDMSWNVATQPAKYTSLGGALVPGSYIGRAGFVRMVNEVINLVATLEASYYQQESLLRQIDLEIKRRHIFTGTFKTQLPRVKTITDYLLYNEFQDRQDKIIRNKLKTVEVDRSGFFKSMERNPQVVQKQKNFPLLSTKISRQLHPVFLERFYSSANLNNLIAQLKSLMAEGSVQMDKLFYILIIVEEAISRVQSTRAAPGDLVSY